VFSIQLTLLHAFPYRLFKKPHTWLAAAYLVLVYHSLILMKVPYWASPIGWMMAVLLLVGTVSALCIVSGRVGSGRRVQGRIDSLQWYTGVQIREAVPEWRSASVWFCGPNEFGRLLCRDFRGPVLPANRFHQELFAFR